MTVLSSIIFPCSDILGAEDRSEADAILSLVEEEETQSERLESATTDKRRIVNDEQVYSREQVQEQEQVMCMCV